MENRLKIACIDTDAWRLETDKLLSHHERCRNLLCCRRCCGSTPLAISIWWWCCTSMDDVTSSMVLRRSTTSSMTDLNIIHPRFSHLVRTHTHTLIIRFCRNGQIQVPVKRKTPLAEKTFFCARGSTRSIGGNSTRCKAMFWCTSIFLLQRPN